MRYLVVGGTLFAGRAIVDAALEAGHDVTLFNRGKTNPGLYPDLRTIIGDRDGELSALDGLRFDVVVDTSAYFPRQIRSMVSALGEFGSYVFLSSASVYADHSVVGQDEDAAAEVLEDDSVEELGEKYGAFKALCEDVLREETGARALIVRAGLIVGPHDNKGRFTYWVRRIAQGGEVLAPMPKEQPVQFIDVRDLAEWVVDASSRGVGGTFNVASPPGMDMETMLTSINAATGGGAEFTWVDDDFLIDRGVEPWSDLPLWLSPGSLPSHAGFMSRDTRRAAGEGLTVRPLEQTVAATLVWTTESDGADQTKDFGNPPQQAGLSRSRERELLEVWHRSGR